MNEGVVGKGGNEEQRRSLVQFYAERVARDAALAARVRAGDGDALAELYRIYFASLCRAAACEVGDDAPDAVQKVFLKIWLIRERWTVNKTVVAYLFKSVRNRDGDAAAGQAATAQRAAVCLPFAPGD